MKKHQPEMVEIQLNKKEPSQKAASPQKAHVPYSRTIAKIELNLNESIARSLL